MNAQKMQIRRGVHAIAAMPVAIALLISTNATADPVLQTSTSSLEAYAEPHGPFESTQSVEELTETRTYRPEVPQTREGRVVTQRTTHSKYFDGGEFGNSGLSTGYESTSSSFTSERAGSFPGMAIGANKLSADVSELGGTSIRANYRQAQQGADGGYTFAGTSSAGWSDTWLIPSTADHAPGTAGRLRVALSFDGAYTTSREFEDGDAEFFTVKPAKAAAQFGSTTLASAASWVTTPQHRTTNAYVDFLYGESFVAMLNLTSTTWRVAGFPFFNASESFSAEITEVLIPLGTTLNHSFGSFNVANSSDPGLYPNAPVPEPSTWALLLTGIAALGCRVMRRRAMA